MKARVYRDVPTPILRDLIARNERDGFSDGKYTRAMRDEMLHRALDAEYLALSVEQRREVLRLASSLTVEG